MKTPKHAELAQFTPNLTNIVHELGLLLKSVKSNKHKKGIASIKKLVEKL